MNAMREHYRYPFDFDAWLSVFWSNSFQYDEHYRLRRVFKHFYLLQAVTAAAYLIYGLRRPQAIASIKSLIPWCAAGFVLFSFYFVPVHIYYLYTAFLFPAAFVIVAADACVREDTAGPKIPRRVLQTLRVVVAIGLVTTLHFSFSHLLRLANRIERETIVTVDDVYTNVEQMSERLGISGDGGAVFTDMVSWIGAGRNAHSLIDVCVYLIDFPLPAQRVAGVVYERMIHEVRLRDTRGMRPLAPDPARRLGRFKSLLPATEPAGFVIDRRGQMDFYFYRAGDVASTKSELVAVLDGGAISRWFTIDRDMGNPLTTERLATWSDLPSGAHLLSLVGKYAEPTSISVVLESEGRTTTVKTWNVSEMQECIPCVAFVEVSEPGASITVATSSRPLVLDSGSLKLRYVVAAH